MPIKKKDGTEFKLRHPPKLSAHQEFWSDEKLVFHNFKFKQSIVKNVQPIVAKKLEVPPVVTTVETFLEEIKVQPEVKETLPIEEPKKIENKIFTFALPSYFVEVEDDLYGEKYKKIHYKEKITFESILIDRGDLSLSFWTNISLQKGSVVYFSKYIDGQKISEFRWWKVSKSEPAEEGFVYYCINSDYQPDFSD